MWLGKNLLSPWHSRPLTWKKKQNETTNRPRLLWFSFEVSDKCAPSLIYCDLFSETNKPIWKTSDTFLSLPHLGCLEFWVIICQASGCQASMKNCFPSHKIIFIGLKLLGKKRNMKKSKCHPVLLQHKTTLSLEEKKWF